MARMQCGGNGVKEVVVNFHWVCYASYVDNINVSFVRKGLDGSEDADITCVAGETSVPVTQDKTKDTVTHAVSPASFSVIGGASPSFQLRTSISPVPSSTVYV